MMKIRLAGTETQENRIRKMPPGNVVDCVRQYAML